MSPPSSSSPLSLVQRSRASSMLSDVRLVSNTPVPSSSASLRPVGIRSQETCGATPALEFRPQVVVGREGHVQAQAQAQPGATAGGGNKENPVVTETRRPSVLLFDANERFLNLTAKVICRRLRQDHCLVYSSQASVIATACGGGGGGGDAPGSLDAESGGAAVEQVHVMWKKDGVLQRSMVPLCRGMASGAACVVVKYGDSSSTDLSPRRSLDANSGDFLLAALARSGALVPAVVCVRDSLRDVVHNAVKATGRVVRATGATDQTLVTAVLGQTSMARTLEKQLQRCCPWALLPVQQPGEDRLSALDKQQKLDKEAHGGSSSPMSGAESET